MTISSRVRQQFYHPNPTKQEETPTQSPNQQQVMPVRSQVKQLIRIPQTKCGVTEDSSLCAAPLARHMWTAQEHDRFLQALELFPHGPWKAIAQYIGTKTARQVMSHGQKYRQKIARRMRGLKVNPPQRHRVIRTVTDSSTTAPLRFQETKCSDSSVPQQEATPSMNRLNASVHLDRRFSQPSNRPDTSIAVSVSTISTPSVWTDPLHHQHNFLEHQDHQLHHQLFRAHSNQHRVELRPPALAHRLAQVNRGTASLHQQKRDDEDDHHLLQFLDGLMDVGSADDLAITTVQTNSKKHLDMDVIKTQRDASYGFTQHFIS